MVMSDLPRRPKAVQRAVVRPATADEAADACEQDEVPPPAAEVAVPVSPIEITPVVEATLPNPPAEASTAVSVTVTEIEVQIAPVPESLPPAAVPAPPAAPPSDDFGVGLVD